MADLPVIRITAVDQASATIGKISGSLAGFAAQMISVGAAVESMRRAINLGDSIQQVADQTGVAVAALDRLSIVASQNGTDLDSMARGFKALTASMTEAQSSTSKAGQIFDALHVSVKDASGQLRSTDVVMGDVAKALGGIQNETLRAAVGNEIFGKSYQQIAAALRNYEEGQRVAAEVTERFGAVTEEAAAVTDSFGDRLDVIAQGSQRALLNGMVPGLRALNAAMDEAGKSSGGLMRGFGQLFSWLATNGAQILNSTIQLFRVVGTTIGAVFASIATRSLDPMRQLGSDIAQIERETIAANQKIQAAYDGTATSVDKATAASNKNNVSAQDAARLQALLAPAVKKTADEYDLFTKAVMKAYNAAEQWAKMEEEGNKAYDAMLAAQLDAATKSIEKNAELIKQGAEIAAGYDRQTIAIGKTQEELALLDAQKLQDYADSLRVMEGADQIADAYDRAAAAARRWAEESGAAKAAAAAQKSWESMINSISRSFGQFLNDWVDYGANKAFKNLWDSFKRWALEALAQVAARQVVVSIVGAVSGVAAGNAAANSLGQLSTGASLVNSLGGLTGLGSAFSAASLGYSAAAAGYGAIGGQTVGMMMAAGAGDLTAVGAGGIAAGLEGGLAAGLSAIPVAGWIALGGIIVAGIVMGMDKGDAMRTGFWSQGGVLANADKNKIGKSAFGDFGISFSKWFGDDMNDAFKTLIKSIEGMDNAIAAAVGPDLTAKISAALAGQGGSYQFGMEHTNFNETGVSGEILRQRYTIALNTVDAGLGDLIKNFEGTGEQLAAFIMALLQMDASIKDSATMVATFGQAITLDDLKGAALAGEQVTDTFKRLTSVFAATNGVAFMLGKDTASAFGAVGLASTEARQKLVDLAGGVQALNDKTSWYYSNFLDDTDRAALLLPSVTKTMTELGYASVDTVDEFKALVKSIDLSTESGLALYNSLMDVAPSFLLVAKAAKDAANAVDTVATALGPSGLLTTHLRTMIGGPGAGGALFGAVNGNARPDFGAQRAQVIADNLAAVNQALDDLGVLSDPVAAAFASMASAWDQLIAQGNALDATAAYYDGSAASTQALAQATQSYYQAVVQTITAIEQLKTSIGDLWAGNVRTFQMDTLDNEGKYAFLRAETESLMAQLQAATDPARIQALSQQIAADQSQAWQLLTPEQKAQQQGQFIAGAQFANEIAQARLAEAEKLAKERADALVDAVRDAMAEAAAKFSGAADKQDSAANMMQDAAVTIANTHITVDVTGSDTATVGTYGINLPRKR